MIEQNDYTGLWSFVVRFAAPFLPGETDSYSTAVWASDRKRALDAAQLYVQRATAATGRACHVDPSTLRSPAAPISTAQI